MGRIPSEFIDSLMARVDIVDIIETTVPLKKAGRDYTACCPFHEEKTPSFTVSREKQFYHCFGCGAHGTAIGFLMEHERMEFVDAVEELAGRLSLEVPREKGKSGTDHKPAPQPELYEILEETAAFYSKQLRSHPQAEKAVSYLKDRGLSGEIARDFGIGYAPPGWDNLSKSLATSAQRKDQLLRAGMLSSKDNGRQYDRFRDRIMFPIRDRRGRVIAFGGRTLSDDDGPKYLNSPETPVFHKGQELYGLFEARQANRRIERVLVVEGYMDVVALAQYGVRFSVATLGTATSQEHLERLFRATSEIIFCFDGDRAGRQAAWRALENALPIMRDGRQARFLFLPDGEDPDTLIRKEGTESFIKRLPNATPLSEFFFAQLLLQTDPDSIDGRARLVELAKPLLSKMPDGVFRQMMQTRLGEITQLDLGRLNSHLKAGPKSKIAKAATSTTRQGLTLVGKTVAILLQHPHLAQSAKNCDELGKLELAGMQILTNLLQLAQQHPNLNAAAILERWRGHKDAAYLGKLASKDLTIPDDGVKPEFLDCLSSLKGKLEDQRTDELLAKNSLNESEKAELQKLLNHKAP